MSDKNTGSKRKASRRRVGIEGRYRSGTGRSRHVWLTDLSPQGCRFYDKFGSMQPGKRITIRIGPVGPVPAVVRWWENHVNGVQFEEPLHESVYQHICEHLSEVVPAGLDAGEDPGADETAL